MNNKPKIESKSRSGLLDKGELVTFACDKISAGIVSYVHDCVYEMIVDYIPNVSLQGNFDAKVTEDRGDRSHRNLIADEIRGMVFIGENKAENEVNYNLFLNAVSFDLETGDDEVWQWIDDNADHLNKYLDDHLGSVQISCEFRSVDFPEHYEDEALEATVEGLMIVNGELIANINLELD